MKGRLEEAIDALNFNLYVIFRPGLLLRKDTDRAGERFSAAVLKFLNSLGFFKKLRPMPTAILAVKLAKAPQQFPQGQHIVELDKIFSL